MNGYTQDKIAVCVTAAMLSCTAVANAEIAEFSPNGREPSYYLRVLEECAARKVTNVRHIHAAAHPQNGVDDLDTYLNYVIIENPLLRLRMKAKKYALGSLAPFSLPTIEDINICMQALIQVHSSYCTFNDSSNLGDQIPFFWFQAVPSGLSCDPKDLLIGSHHTSHKVLECLIDNPKLSSSDMIDIDVSDLDCW